MEGLRIKDATPDQLKFSSPIDGVGIDPSFGSCSISRDMVQKVDQASEAGRDFAAEPLRRKICSEIAPISVLALMGCKDSWKKFNTCFEEERISKLSLELEAHVSILSKMTSFEDTTESLAKYKEFCEALRESLSRNYSEMAMYLKSKKREVRESIPVTRAASTHIKEIKDFIMARNKMSPRNSREEGSHVNEYLGYLRSDVQVGDRLLKRNKTNNEMLAATALAAIDETEARAILKRHEKKSYYEALLKSYENVISSSGDVSKYQRQQSSVSQPCIALFWAFHLIKVTEKEFNSFCGACNALSIRALEKKRLEAAVLTNKVLGRLSIHLSKSADQYLPVFVPTIKRSVMFMASIFGCFHPDDLVLDWMNKSPIVSPPPCSYYITNLSHTSEKSMDIAALLWITRSKKEEKKEEDTYLATWLFNTTVVGHNGIFDDVFQISGGLKSVEFHFVN